MEKANVKDDQVVAFLVETLERADAHRDSEGLLVAARTRGYQIQQHHVRAASERLQQRRRGSGELDDDALDGVSGGGVQNRALELLSEVMRKINEVDANTARNFRG